MNIQGIIEKNQHTFGYYSRLHLIANRLIAKIRIIAKKAKTPIHLPFI
jgi:hypothetical protein